MNKMSKFHSYPKFFTWFMALMLGALLAGCGGGGGDSSPVAAPASTTVSGIAASGAPIVGATVQMVCAGSTPGTAVSTGTDGGFTVTAPLTAPCVIKVSGATGAIGGPLFSVVASPSQTRANVNQLTHMLAFLLAGGDPDTGLFQSPSSISSKITTAAVATHKATITASVIANLGAAAGIPTSFDFLEGTFTANHTEFDLLLDKIGFTVVGNTVSIMLNGAPLLAVDATTGVASTTSSAVISTTDLTAASTFGAPVTAKAVTALSFAGLPGVAGVIDETAKTIAVTVPSGTNVTALVADFAITGASVKVGTEVQTSGVTANDFTNPVAFTVTDANGVTATYTVTVTVASDTAKALTAFSFAGITGAAGTIDETAKTVAVTVPNGTNVTALVATFTTTGTGVKVGTTVQTRGVTANNFTSPVAYIVTAADATTATYTVTVTVATGAAKALTAYSFVGFPADVGVIDETVTPKTITVNLPKGTNLTALVATFTTTGSTVKVGTKVQTSTATANDFTTSPVAYVVTAADASTATYNVSVTLGLGPAPVLLGTAGNFVILAKSAVSTVPSSAITGDVGVSPAATTFLTGFSLTMVGTTSATSTQVTGSLYGADMTTPTSSNLTTAVSNMEAAYTDAATRPAPPDFQDLGTGEIGGKTLTPGLYTWTTAVTISDDVTISGGANDVWIFQIPGNLTMSAAKNVILGGKAKAKNVFWQVAGAVEIGTTAHVEGIVLSQTAIHLRTGASINGRVLAQSAVTLDTSTVTKPAP